MCMIRILVDTMKLQMKKSFVRPMFRFCLLVNPILNTIVLYEMYRNSGEGNFFAYVILGAGLMGIWSCICFSSVGDINRERYGGTLSLIFPAPCGFELIILGQILGNTVLSMVTLVISMVTAMLLFHVPCTIGSPGYFVIALFILILSFIVISYMISGLLTLSRKTELYMNLIEIPFILLCGFVYPVESLPFFLQAISHILAPTYAIETLRMAVWGVEDYYLFWEKAMWTLGLTFIYGLISRFLFYRIEKRVRILGTLEVA